MYLYSTVEEINNNYYNIEEILLDRLGINSTEKYSFGSVVEHCVSSAKVVGSIPREHTY